MGLTILIILIMLGLLIPLFWITGTLTGIISLCLHWRRAAHKEGAFVLNPQLGLTMADGGDPVDKEEKG